MEIIIDKPNKSAGFRDVACSVIEIHLEYFTLKSQVLLSYLDLVSFSMFGLDYLWV